MKWLEPWRVAYVIAYLLGALTIQALDTAEERMTPGMRLNQCLPEDRCTLRIEPKDAPWNNLTCDLNTGRCEDK